MDQYQVIKMPVGDIAANCIIVGNQTTKEAICFDPGAEGKRILRDINNAGFKLTGIFLTHSHFDHIMGIRAIKEELGDQTVKVYASDVEQRLLGKPELNLSTMFGDTYSLLADETLSDGQEIMVLGTNMSCILTPGHTEGGMCYYFPLLHMVISGDTLFEGSIGRSDFPTGDADVLISSIREKLYALPDDTKVYPGHGEPTTIGHEKKSNYFVRG